MLGGSERQLGGRGSSEGLLSVQHCREALAEGAANVRPGGRGAGQKNRYLCASGVRKNRLKWERGTGLGERRNPGFTDGVVRRPTKVWNR